jgi:predicted TIM-barrel enzyme
MGKQYTAEAVAARLRATVAEGRPVYVVGAGTGISAKMAELGGADIVATYAMARYRMWGHSSMAGYLSICDNNQVTLEMGEREVIPAVREVPVVAGLLGVDPTRDMSRLLDRVREAGFSGIHNCPTVALIDGTFRVALEETGLGFHKEVEMVRLAHERDLFTQVFVTTPEEAQEMVAAGADLVIAHMGNSIGGTVGMRTSISLDDAVGRVQAIIDAVRASRSDGLVICHGGPIATPEDFAYVLQRTRGLVGFMGGSAAERFPVEHGIKAATERFKAVRLH